MYQLIRPFLFLLPPERAHHLTFYFLGIASKLPIFPMLFGAKKPKRNAQVNVLGMTFPSPVGLAAGMDKDAKHIDEMSKLGFGFIEIGTLTPKPQSGNPQPRLFRLPADRALINRMGFNNGGVELAVERLKARTSNIIVGGNIGKNKVTPNEQALRDYEICFEALYPVVDYFVVNVSSPNTPGLRELQDKKPLLRILSRLHEIGEQRRVSEHAEGASKPILLKIAPDLTDAQLDDVCAVVKESGISGVIATNTTISRNALSTSDPEIEKMGAGGLSGSPLRQRSTEVIKYLRGRLPEASVIIGVGGIDSAEAAMEKIDAGADLVQVYTGLIYEGPRLLSKINVAYADR